MAPCSKSRKSGYDVRWRWGPAPALSHVVAEERNGAVWSLLSELEAADREVLVLRGIEGRAHKEVGALLSISPENAMARWHRALKRLRARLPASVFEDLRD